MHHSLLAWLGRSFTQSDKPITQNRVYSPTPDTFYYEFYSQSGKTL